MKKFKVYPLKVPSRKYMEGVFGKKNLKEMLDSLKQKPSKNGLVFKGRTHSEKYLIGDTPCMDCETRDNTIWSTKNVFWNEVMDGVKGSGILCIQCFSKRAERKTKVKRWFLMPEFR